MISESDSEITALFSHKKQKSLSGESPGKFNQWIRRPRLGLPTYMGAARIRDGRESHGKAPLCADQGPTFPDLRILCRIRTSEKGKFCERSSLLLFCLLFFLGTAFSSVYHRPILEEGRCEKMEFPDVSSFPCPSPYRGCGKRQFGNQIHHLMRSFQSSTINIVWGSFFRPLARKNFENLFQCSPVLP